MAGCAAAARGSPCGHRRGDLHRLGGHAIVAALIGDRGRKRARHRLDRRDQGLRDRRREIGRLRIAQQGDPPGEQRCRDRVDLAFGQRDDQAEFGFGHMAEPVDRIVQRIGRELIERGNDELRARRAGQCGIRPISLGDDYGARPDRCGGEVNARIGLAQQERSGALDRRRAVHRDHPSAFTISSTIFLASARSIIVLS